MIWFRKAEKSGMTANVLASNIGIAEMIQKHTKQWKFAFFFHFSSMILASEITWGYELLFWTWRCNSIGRNGYSFEPNEDQFYIQQVQNGNLFHKHVHMYTVEMTVNASQASVKFPEISVQQ